MREAAPLSCSLVLRGMRGSAWKSWVAWLRLEMRLSSSFLQGTRPRFASGTLMSLRTIPPFLAGHSKGYRAGVAAFSERVLRITARRLSQPRYRSVPVCTFLRSCRGTHPLGCSASPCFAAESTREGTLMSLPEGAPACSGWGVKFGHPDVITDDTAPLASPTGA